MSIETAMRFLGCAGLWLGLIAGAQGAVRHVAPEGNDAGLGSETAPWRTLQHAVDQLQPGDVLRVGPGEYPESVVLRRGGSSQDQPIVIEAAPGARPVISGADLAAEGWRPTEDREVYEHDWAHAFRWNTWDPKAAPQRTHPDDGYHQLIGRCEQVIWRGFLLRQVAKRPELARGAFWIDDDAGRIRVRLPDGGHPKDTDLRLSVRQNWLTAGSNVSFVHLRGLTFRYAANFAQRGALEIGQNRDRPAGRGGPRDATGWMIEDCTFEYANGPGAGFTGNGLTVRRCVFRNNSQLGFTATRCHDALFSDCLIEGNNTKGYSTGWEAGGNKVALSRGFTFERCLVRGNHGPGIWFDIGNERGTVRGCHIEGNDSIGLYYEISFGLHAYDNQIVNNANIGQNPPWNYWGDGGITLASSADCLVERNLIVNNRLGVVIKEQDRETPRIDDPPGTAETAMHCRNLTVRDNVIAWSGQYNVALCYDTRFFGPHPSGNDRDKPALGDPRDSKLTLGGNRLTALPGRSNYLYGVDFRPAHRVFPTPEEFARVSGIPDDSTLDAAGPARPAWPATQP